MYWFGRYMERSENTARLAIVNSNLVYDLPLMMHHIWGSLINITGSDELFYERFQNADERNVIKFILADESNPSSIRSSVKAARENVRATREKMPSEAWEQINELHIFVKSKISNALRRSDRHEILDDIIHFCHQITGLLAGGMSHGSAYHFYRIGRCLEQADMTTRIVDVGSLRLSGRDDEILETYRNILWVNVLRSLSGYQMYRQFVKNPVNSHDVINYLLCNLEFPRSLAYSLGKVNQCVLNMPNNDLPLRSITRAQRGISELQDADLIENKLHESIDKIQIDLADIHDQVTQAWFAYTPQGQEQSQQQADSTR